MYKFIIAIIILGISCTKKEDRYTDKKADTIYDTVSTMPGNRIVSFRIANINQETIYSAVNDSAKTITAYLPWYYTLNFIDPEISLSQDASISPASGELVDVFATTPTQYTVTGKDGRTRKYDLQIVIQQPELVLNELSTSTTTAPFNISSSSIILTGKNFITDMNVTKVYLVARDNTRWSLATFNSGTDRSNNIVLVAPGVTHKDNPPPPGLYHIEMNAYSLQARMQYPIELK